jgi:hypothetical protein
VTQSADKALRAEFPECMGQWTHEVATGDRWLSLVRGLCRYLYGMSAETQLPPAKVLQVKEKFGGLRLYVESPTEEQSLVVQLAEMLSFSICERCGATRDVTPPGSPSGARRSIPWSTGSARRSCGPRLLATGSACGRGCAATWCGALTQARRSGKRCSPRSLDFLRRSRPPSWRQPCVTAVVFPSVTSRIPSSPRALPRAGSSECHRGGMPHPCPEGPTAAALPDQRDCRPSSRKVVRWPAKTSIYCAPSASSTASCPHSGHLRATM